MKKIRLTESDLQRIVKRVLNEQMGVTNNPDELCNNILNNYIFPIMDDYSMDEASDEFTYYDNVIDWGIEKYIHSEEPDRENDWNYRDYLGNMIKDCWMPI